jgi:small subunit ribosomal protein S16
MGRKKQPFYRIVAIDSRARRDGKYLEKIGHYNPLLTPSEVLIDRDLAFKWLQNGAQLSDTVRNLFQDQGIMMEWDLRKRKLSDDQIAKEMEKWQSEQEDRKRREEAKAAMEKRKGGSQAAAEPEPEPESAKEETPEPEQTQEQSSESEEKETE